MPKSALVTGASSGIGLATANALLEQGFEVTGLARNSAKMSDNSFQAIACDLSDLDALPTRLAEMQASFDLLVLNAGVGRFGGIEQFSYRQIQQLVNTNLVSNLFLVKHFLPRMRASGGGDIVLIGSESALQGAKQGSVYCATKFALRGLAQSLRADCATANIRVSLVNPGPVESNFFDDLEFAPQNGDEFIIEPATVASAIVHALNQPRTVVTEEINLQPIKRSFQKRK